MSVGHGGLLSGVSWSRFSHYQKIPSCPAVTPGALATRIRHRRFAVENIIAKAQELVDDPKLAREVALHICHRHSGEMLKNIGAHFGLGDSAVVKVSTRLEARLNSEAALRDKVKEILTSLGRVKVQT